jgi:hypothetical protein
VLGRMHRNGLAADGRPQKENAALDGELGPLGIYLLAFL